MGRPQKSQGDDFPRLAALGLKACPVRGDGNCLFNALSDQLYGDQSKHLEIRQAVVRQMRENPEDFKAFIHVDQVRRRNPKRKNAGTYASQTSENVTEEQIEHAWSEYLKNMAQNGTYADNQEIRAFTKAYNTNVEVFQKSKEIYCFRAPEDSATRPTAYIAYHGPDYEHYSSVRKLNGLLIEDSQITADNLTSNPPSPGRYSRSGSSSIERDADSDDEDIYGPNKRQNRRLSGASKASHLSDILTTTVEDEKAVPTVELTKPDSTISSLLLPPLGLPPLSQLPAKTELPELSGNIDEIPTDKLAPSKIKNAHDSDEWAPSEEDSDDVFNLEEETDATSSSSSSSRAASVSFDTIPPKRITIKFTCNKSMQKQPGPQKKKPAARDQKYLKKAAQKQARKERFQNHNSRFTQKHLEQVMTMNKLYI